VTQTLTLTIAFVAPVAANLAVDVIYQTPTALKLPVGGTVTAVTIVTQPAHGTLTQPTAAGNITYTPAAGYSGPDSFTYHATGPAATASTRRSRSWSAR
jgi:hypothetical protein